MLLFISAFRTKISSSLAFFNAQVQDHQGGWLSKYSATVVVGIAVATFLWRHAWIRWAKHRRIQDLHEISSSDGASTTSENSELHCCCGLPAKLRMSKTLRNPYRLFYNCPKNVFHHQCEYFHWSDELSASVERSRTEISFLRNECILLHKRIAYVQSRRENDRALWEVERSELRSEVTSVQAELDDINSRVQPLYELDNMPPVDELYAMNAENDGVIDIEII